MKFQLQTLKVFLCLTFSAKQMSFDINYNSPNTDTLLLPSPPTNKQTNVQITLIDKHLFIGKKWGVEVAVTQSNSASGRNKKTDYKTPLGLDSKN